MSLGAGPGGSLVLARRRRRRRWPLAVLVLAVAAGGVIQRATEASDTRPVDGDHADRPGDGAADPTAARPQATDAPGTADGTPDVGADVASDAADRAAEATPPLARLGDLELALPSQAPLVVGYHEAATVTALGVTPVGTLTEDRNTTRTDLPADVAGGHDYLVLSSRGRSAGPTSAIDVVLPPGEAVLAPVTGTVLDVRSYLLYGAHQDVRIELVPEGRPDVRLVVIHVDAPQVAIGDRVIGGVTPVAGTARRFPFSSHIDRETEPERFPHVHLELQPIDAPRPSEPPADEPEASSDDGDAEVAADG